MHQLGLPMDGIPAAAAPSPAPRQIGFLHGSMRLRALEKEHARLLRKVASLRAAHERLTQDLRAATTAMAMDMQPLIEETLALDGELHALFREMLTDPKRGKRVKGVVRDVYAMLQGHAITPAPGADRDGAAPDAGGDWSADDEGPPFSGNFGEDFDADPGTGLGPASAARPMDRGTLRALFRRLAEALHPDKATDDDTRASRTEAMKEVTAAYHEGDYARLIEIERRSLTQTRPRGAPGDRDDFERRCALVVASNLELRAQAKALQRETRELRRSPPFEMFQTLKRPGAKEELLAEARQELASMRALRDFVRSFREGKISLDEFKRGPEIGEPENPSGHDTDADLEFFAFMAELTRDSERPARPPRARRASGRPRRRR